MTFSADLRGCLKGPELNGNCGGGGGVLELLSHPPKTFLCTTPTFNLLSPFFFYLDNALKKLS